MNGNYMDYITFTVTNKNSYFSLDFSENSDYVHIYTHLVTVTYDSTYNVKISLGLISFKYKISLVSEKNDQDYGNGPYDILKCEIKQKN